MIFGPKIHAVVRNTAAPLSTIAAMKAIRAFTPTTTSPEAAPLAIDRCGCGSVCPGGAAPRARFFVIARYSSGALNLEPVLVTGGSGFVGSHIVAQLLASGRAVRTTVRSSKREADVHSMLANAGV